MTDFGQPYRAVCDAHDQAIRAADDDVERVSGALHGDPGEATEGRIASTLWSLWTSYLGLVPSRRAARKLPVAPRDPEMADKQLRSNARQLKKARRLRARLRRLPSGSAIGWLSAWRRAVLRLLIVWKWILLGALLVYLYYLWAIDAAIVRQLSQFLGTLFGDHAGP